MVNLYMVSHSTNLPLIPIIKNKNKILIKNHLTHISDFSKDFNKDVFLDGRLHNNIPQNP